MDLPHCLLTKWLYNRRTQKMPALGHRELEVLNHLWRDGSMTALALHEQIIAVEEVSLNTIQSTLERLRAKALVHRKKVGRAYFYTASLTRTDVVKRVLHDLVREVGAGDPAPIISGFAGFVGGNNPDFEEELRKLLDETDHKGE
jgi:predicted transcriptional regulator